MHNRVLPSCCSPSRVSSTACTVPSRSEGDRLRGGSQYRIVFRSLELKSGGTFTSRSCGGHNRRSKNISRSLQFVANAAMKRSSHKSMSNQSNGQYSCGENECPSSRNETHFFAVVFGRAAGRSVGWSRSGAARAGQTQSRRARRARGCLVGHAHGGALGRSSRALPALSNLPPSIRGVAKGRGAARVPAPVGRRPRGRCDRPRGGSLSHLAGGDGGVAGLTARPSGAGRDACATHRRRRC